MSIVHATEIRMAVILALLPGGNYKIQSLVLFSSVTFIALCIIIHWLV